MACAPRPAEAIAYILALLEEHEIRMPDAIEPRCDEVVLLWDEPRLAVVVELDAAR